MGRKHDKKRIMLHFDGERMNATENGRYSGGWKAVSGEKNSQSPNQKHAPYQQHVKGEGPIPEGVFSVEELQYPPEGGMERWLGHAGRGTWPGLEESWGNSRAWLTPKSGSPFLQTRSGFSIHGGAEAGSAGCIDLTDQMDDFADLYRKTGQSADLIVSYPGYEPELDQALQFLLEKRAREQSPMSESSEGYRWEPDASSGRTRHPLGGISLGDALRTFE
ncbi:L,D-transpeptidase family protein [Sinorhizobium medicae]|uniref:L,D-TPase catalytic domain-containing protein n=3 Tax=Sinorhizobium medicae TaxID=110321 RepID=A6UAI3_SINMW|nr:L,D-transpeptidase family protein [Sinorhizobium medicae]ABR60663.1 hypothetical protein Smed_1828 [Sinorhizobium medicae WSM419]MBO1965019.1 DUF2778 domain-containing protein [Sinorhizobium medicae]MDX0406488.1 DUF2778 domain-containing protein [Sinorhizobium medicae]MDX0413039.1 DUF2778 domain-containing protein [Sinorhizobium medicae]MDX0418840.1 DUF2778 domain-containing protein [Sinorhizobium medicae]